MFERGIIVVAYLKGYTVHVLVVTQENHGNRMTKICMDASSKNSGGGI
jgi:hypothetical protein